MASQTGSTSFPLSEKSREGAHIIARQDRIPAWSFPYLFIAIIGVGFLFTFFDIFDINVSFIQTCTQIVPGCSPPTAANYLGLPVLWNLIGYVIGSLYTVFVADYTHFIIARTITGIGIGADLALVNTYINEVAPLAGRARYTSLIFIMSSLGAFLGIWLGLILTTPATPFPQGLPFALAAPGFETGWRVMYGIGALLALIGLL